LRRFECSKRLVEQIIRDLLARHYPEYGVFGEEFGWTTSNDPYTWIVNPIDGTKSFLAGAPTYGMLLDLLYDGVPVLGIVDIPALEERWCGVVGQAATMNGQPVKTRNSRPGAIRLSRCSPGDRESRWVHHRLGWHTTPPGIGRTGPDDGKSRAASGGVEYPSSRRESKLAPSLF